MCANEAANYMLYIMSDAFDDLTNIKISRLLYLAQGYHLKEYGAPMFEDAIEAWECGPIIPEVFLTYKEYGDKSITDYDIKMVSGIASEAEEIMFGVAREYGKYTDRMLWNLIQVKGSPWDQAYDGSPVHAEISLSSMQSYFSAQKALKPAIKHFDESDFVGYRDTGGILVLPKEWDD